MVADVLSELAGAAGLILDWEDAQGAPRRVAPDALRAVLTAMGHACGSGAECRESLERLRRPDDSPMLVIEAGRAFQAPDESTKARLTLEGGETRDLTAEAGGLLPPIPEFGYHTLDLEQRSITLAVCPPRCVTPLDRLGRRAWGLTVQIYSLAGPGSFGDFGDLANFAAEAGGAGADVLAISPVHALFASDPNHYSPYSPSSRDLLHGLFADTAVLSAPPRATASEPLIDWSTAWPQKLQQIRQLLPKARADSRFHAFVRSGGEDLRLHALFEALHSHFKRSYDLHDFRDWPVEFRRPGTAEAAAGALGVGDELDFHLALQWLADMSLEQAQSEARRAGMGIGLITDLAVGLDPAGSHAWARPDDLLAGLTLGAPPDAFQAKGQGWGITSFSPEALRRTGFAPFLRTLRAALRHAGGLRIDHALGLKRIWVLPEGASPLDGAYLKYPFEDLLKLIALESHRAQAIVIGEDLGVVPAGLREALDADGVLGMRVLPFEREKDGGFRAPSDYDARAAAMTSTHDLPPIAGWWRGRDIEWRERLGGPLDRSEQEASRRTERTAFWTAAAKAGLVEVSEPPLDDPQPAVDAAIAFTAATPCELLLLPVEDLLGLEEQVNLPGIVEQHPNWRRRLPVSAADIFTNPVVRRRVERLNSERPR